jgi:tRNA nucleotidyltransferase/poly(A) polymerase
MRSDAHLLSNSTPERVRDEILRILDGPKPASAFRTLDGLGILASILPELVELKDIHQSPPHISNVWNHTLGVIKSLDTLIKVLSLDYNQDNAASLYLGLASTATGRSWPAI